MPTTRAGSGWDFGTAYEPAAGPWQYRTDETIAHSVFDEGAVSQREPYYVGFWKAWWQQNQATLAQ